MHSPLVTPALVTRKAVARLPRVPLLLLCAAYIVPGMLGREPWKDADIASFGQMWSIALGHASWMHPQVGGVAPALGGILPYWMGAAVIQLLSPVMDPALAARLPFALMLAAVLALTWRASYLLALTEAARPLPLVFGGEAPAKDYARALADGALLALIASLGLLQLGHETTPEILQLLGATLILFSLAGATLRPAQARLAIMVGMPMMATSGSPSVALCMGAAAMVVSWRSRTPLMRRFIPWCAAAAGLSVGLVWAMQAQELAAWGWRMAEHFRPKAILELVIWFTWPTLPLAALTVWHWRRQLGRRHMALPLLCAAVPLASCIFMGGNDRALLAALPALAVLAAFALPVLQRSLGAALDWFSVCFFTTLALLIWLGYVAIQTGFPPRTAVNVLKFVPDIKLHFSWWTLVPALVGTLLWMGLVRWRTSRRSHALWKSLALPAGGVALAWLLFMTLWLPLLDQARSYRILLNRIGDRLPAGAMVCTPGAPVSLMTGLEYYGGVRVEGTGERPPSAQESCDYMVLRIKAKSLAPHFAGWHNVLQVNQRTRNSEEVAIYRRER